MTDQRENATLRHRRAGTTVLYAARHKSGGIRCFFKARRRGARAWRTIVDTFGEQFVWLEGRTGHRVLGRDPAKTLGQGAVVVLEPEAYGLIRLRFERERVVERALQRGELVIDESATARRAVADLRGRLQQRRKEERDA